MRDVHRYDPGGARRLLADSLAIAVAMLAGFALVAVAGQVAGPWLGPLGGWRLWLIVSPPALAGLWVMRVRRRLVRELSAAYRITPDGLERLLDGQLFLIPYACLRPRFTRMWVGPVLEWASGGRAGTIPWYHLEDPAAFITGVARRALGPGSTGGPETSIRVPAWPGSIASLLRSDGLALALVLAPCLVGVALVRPAVTTPVAVAGALALVLGLPLADRSMVSGRTWSFGAEGVSVSACCDPAKVVEVIPWDRVRRHSRRPVPVFPWPVSPAHVLDGPEAWRFCLAFYGAWLSVPGAAAPAAG